MAAGMAKGAKKRGKRIAFGDGQKILWDHNSDTIFRGNPNIAKPGDEQASDLEWIGFYKTSRIYNEHDKINHRWLWNYDFKAIPGEIYFNAEETRIAAQRGRGFVVIEPNVPDKLGAINKRWPLERYQTLARKLQRDGFDVRQFAFGKHRLDVHQLSVPSFRHAARVLKNATLYVGPEGGLHHVSAAVGIPAVVMFGGWIPPAVTGYSAHTNLTGGATEFCGSLAACPHCFAAMNAISINEVYQSCLRYLSPEARAISAPMSASN